MFADPPFESPVKQAKVGSTRSAVSLQCGHTEPSPDMEELRISSNLLPHRGQTYSYNGIKPLSGGDTNLSF